jgi:hypothetical protein
LIKVLGLRKYTSSLLWIEKPRSPKRSGAFHLKKN